MDKRKILSHKRVFFGVLTLSAIVAQAVSLISSNVFDPVNYLSYFTNLSNIFAAIVLIISACYLASKRKASQAEDAIRGAAVLYMAVTGVVYSTLLRGVELGLLMVWVNVLLHYVMPLVVVADWLYQPPRTKLSVKHIFIWLIFPAAYLAYTLVRGASVGWYPYPFLNPAEVGGYGGVALFCTGILAAFFGLGWLLVQLGNRLKRNIA